MIFFNHKKTTNNNLNSAVYNPQPKHRKQECLRNKIWDICTSDVDLDEYFVEAGKFIIDKDKASIGVLQRVFKIGFNRASRIMDQLYEYGVVGEETGVAPRKVLMDVTQFESLLTELSMRKKEAPPVVQFNIQDTFLSNDMDNMDGHKFESFCADILKQNNFINVTVTKGSADHGVDILAEKDDITYAIQCKCYSSSIGNGAVQQAYTGKSIYKKDIAVVMTNQFFTQQAKEEASQLNVKLWDRDKLNEMLKNVRTKI